MKRFSTFSLVLVSALVFFLLSGCVMREAEYMTFYFQLGETLHGSEQLFVRYSDGSLSASEQSNPSGRSSVTIKTDRNKTIVGFYVSDGTVSWVPDYSYEFGFVSLSGISAQRPTFPADHVIQASQPVNDVNHPGFVKVTFAVYGTNGQLVDHQTEIFAHSADPNIKFYNTDSRDASFFYPTIDNVKKGSAPPIDNVNEGFSSYTLNGIVTFLIQSDLGKISAKPITLYSGSKLIYDSNISPAIQSLAIGFASGDSADNVNQNVTLPTSGSNITGISWKSSNPEVVSSTGIVHPPGVGSGDANVTVTATVYSSNLFVSKPFHLVVKASLPSGDASLSSLNLSGIILDQLFNGNINAYTATVSNSVSVTTVKYAATDSHTMVALQLNGKTVNNPVSLSAGSNVVRIIVTAQNGNTQTYTLIVTRTVSNIASLSSLNISQGDLTPMFSSANPNYTVEVPNPISSLELSLTKADPSQTLTVTGAVYNTN
jgi:hypothetical protein